MIRFVGLTALYLTSLMLALASNFYPLVGSAGVFCLILWVNLVWPSTRNQLTTTKDP